MVMVLVQLQRQLVRKLVLVLCRRGAVPLLADPAPAARQMLQALQLLHQRGRLYLSELLLPVQELTSRWAAACAS